MTFSDDPHLGMSSERFSGTATRIANLVLPPLERLALLLADEVITVHEPYRRDEKD